MEHLTLGPLTRATGTVRLPGSKSISNRVLLLAALANGETRVRDLLDSDDTRVMLQALRTLGVAWRQDGPDYIVTGAGGNFPVKSAELFMGNAGTAIRPLTAALALQGGSYKLSGVPRMHERPIGDLVDGLRQVGAVIDYLGNEGFPPLHIQPASLRIDAPIRVRGDVSSQFLTALLMSLPLAQSASGRIEIEVVGELISKPYIEITLNLLARFGIEVERQGWERFILPAGTAYRSPGEIFVEGDASSASYFLAAGAIGGGPVRVEGVGMASIQGDVRFADALNRMGANVMAGDNWIEVRGTERDDGRLHGIELDCNHIPDAAMTLAVAALFAEGTTTLTNIASWRVKETDRIAAMATELRKLGAVVEEGADYLRVTPPQPWQTPADGIGTYDDHRMAMCFSLAAFGPLPVRINDPGCVAKTFPDYFSVFAGVTR
ncbi:3-phosphoshikimate 1-carboxyvinyltransferase [Cupriavidus taiwanensis]|uniref:3-phosphoshikimate 1-carboxyvinyltransferase n=1 Tax=Cupriavidus taiwanensis (strain DSM 17343 / BCRC 17206 / CCUG 44338 / CIP 107171 / LMG 19424 / R1) TaxID=977880 RepID=AROA_CUPTR|nr:3-phosphoshikimate 1-carboxyvinyltransferase [Cupriavidus taiwanensis]B3R368.1 RecName: Full=3-phosphoshikimate 1-carboxyvinyltransferase; AltName: Full=5-enolpyruvylshikimate-3-phosphate synthase; Short=EPSP synthase; Short=EPSPS [Cupriavidus taiwanensis LMG 19424]CAQ68748.1 3-enolpyruvylshikimate-5-phosphate synthetase [Cupriavidus taiwanensis LMG 19424]